MRLVVAGTPQVAVPSLETLLGSHHEVLAVITRPDSPAGRGRTLHRSPVKARALEAGIEVLTPRRIVDVLDRLVELAPDACPIVAYGGLVPPAALAVPVHGWINLHFSLLPAWRGAAPVQHAIIAGDEIGGASTFVLEEGLDTGPLLLEARTPIGPTETAGDLLARLSATGAELLLATLDALEAGRVTPRPQPAEGVSLAPKLTVEDARIRWEDPAHAVDARIRGCTPAPGAWTTFRSARLKVHAAARGDADRRDLVGAAGAIDTMDGAPAGLGPGALSVERRRVRVGTGQGELELRVVQPPGKKPMAALDWARGARIEPGEELS